MGAVREYSPTRAPARRRRTSVVARGKFTRSVEIENAMILYGHTGSVNKFGGVPSKAVVSDTVRLYAG